MDVFYIDLTNGLRLVVFSQLPNFAVAIDNYGDALFVL